MGRQKNKPSKKRSPIALATLLVKFFLIKIGQIPIDLSLFFWRLIKFLSPKFYHRLKSHRWVPLKAYRMLLLVMVLIFLVGGYFLFVNMVVKLLPSPNLLQPGDKPLASEVYDRNGKLLYIFSDGINRSLIKLDDLPPYVWQSSVAIEDKNFFKHPGVDPTALARAVWDNLSTGSLQGGSTITQQLVKNTVLSPEKTYQRKLKEILLSLAIESVYSKQQILEMYLNEAPYGGTNWGIEAASQTYFGKPSKNLTLGEAAYLAGLPASPTQFSPYGLHPEFAVDRQKQVLDRMLALGYIKENQKQQALKEQLQIQTSPNPLLSPHFVLYIKDLLTKQYGPKMVNEGGLKIYTSLDLDLQNKVEAIVKDQVNQLSYLNVQNGAAMITDPKTGQILVMVGSKDYSDPQFGNYNSTLALRQPGSSIKVVTYATAFKQGFFPGNTILDMPVSFPDGINRYSPVNYDGHFHGPVSIRTALGSSYNIPAVKMLATVGIDNMIQTAQEMGITTFTDRNRYGLSLTLGGGEVRLIDMMAVYGTLAQMGTLNPVSPIIKITDSYGNILEDSANQQKQVIKPEIAYLITDVLKDDSARQPAFGYHSLLYIPDHQVAVKTGTSDNKRDNWTFGYTPNYVVGVWVGNNDNTPMNPALTSGVTGAAPIWNQIMHTLLDNQQDVAFVKPTDVIETTVDGRKDLAISNSKSKDLVQVFKKDNQTVFIDNFSQYATPTASPIP